MDEDGLRKVLGRIKTLGASAIIRSEGDVGIAIELGENLSEVWQSGDIIVFWRVGCHTALPDEFKLVTLI